MKEGINGIGINGIGIIGIGIKDEEYSDGNSYRIEMKHFTEYFLAVLLRLCDVSCYFDYGVSTRPVGTFQRVSTCLPF